MSVHPRVRGEHSTPSAKARSIAGSSPRARGTPYCVAIRMVVDRFIPACAGNTTRPACPPTPRSVHPRVRGEHITGADASLNPNGSSPRARGTQNAPGRGELHDRFIPACAGNTWWSRRSRRAEPVHPRVRGEHYLSMPSSARTPGSSPRARGTPSCATCNCRSRRFIPACAGNTPATTTQTATSAVHPRVRGEHSPPCDRQDVGAGSSPRARGTPIVGIMELINLRFIPACAGNTTPPPGAYTCRPVHPRVRGEHQPTKDTNPVLAGSSPRARGTHKKEQLYVDGRRFIPACAGNTHHGGFATGGWSVHPRVRGEHSSPG